MTTVEMFDVIHKTICQFFDVCKENEEVPMSDKDKLLLEVNKAICNNLKALEQESTLDKVKTKIDREERWLSQAGYNAYNVNMAFESIKAILSAVIPTWQWNTTPPMNDTYDILLSVKTEDEEPHVWMGFYKDGHYYYADGDGSLEVDDEIAGWMPAPIPYEAKKEMSETKEDMEEQMER